MSKIKNFWPIVLIAILVVIFFWRFFFKGLLPIPADIIVGMYFPWLDYKWGYAVGVPVKNPLISDIPSLVYPWRMFVIDSLRNGFLPLWNPHYFSGMPLLANFQSATFSLANIFFVFLPDIYAWSFGVITQPLLTILFTFLFLRNLKLNKIASLLGGVIFAFCGFSLMWLEYNVLGWTAMWLPLLLLVVDRIIRERRLGWVLGGSFIFALQVFAGYPQIVLYSATAVGFYALFRLFFFWRARRSLKPLIKPILLLILLPLVGISLAAVQILPGFEALKLSVREIDPIAKNVSEGFLPWQNLITFFAPDFFGNPATGNYWGIPWYDNYALYIGILPLFLTVLAILFRKDNLTWFFVFLALFALILAFPTPLAKIVDASGIYGVKAIPARIIFLLDFSLAILVALGLDWLLNTRKNINHIYKIGALIFFILLGIFIGVFVSRQIIFNSLSQFYEGPGLDFISQWLTNLRVALRNLILPLGLSFLGASIFCFLRIKFLRKLLILIYISLTVFELFRFGWKYLPFSKRDFVFPTTPVIEFLQNQEKPFGVNPQGEPFRVEFGETIPQNMWMPYGLESAAGYDAMAPLRYTQFLGALGTGRIDTPYGRVAQVENYNSPLFNFLNIKYVLAVKYDEKEIKRIPEGRPREIFKNPKFKLVFEDKTVQVYENLNVSPRAFLVHDFVVKQNGQEIIDQLLKPDFNLLKSVVLEESLGLEKESFDIRKDSVQYLKYGSQESIIRTNSQSQSLLFISDTFYPGWKAFVDGEETKIYRANFTFRAVFVPKGNHVIRFIYNPRSFKIGAVVSLITLAILGGILVYETKNRLQASV